MRTTEKTAHTPPLTYEQEVHAVLCHAAAASEDLISYFEAQAQHETGYAKKLTGKCIANERHALGRIRALIPRALERRAAAQELLEAAEQFVAWVDNLWGSAALSNEPIAEYEKARVAIRKARGEQ